MHTLTRHRALLVVYLCLSVVGLAGCASTMQGTPPAGTYTPAVQKAFDADQYFKDVQALSDTAINMNASTGKTHLSDKDTQLIKDFALTSGAALQAYANGQGTLVILVTSFQALDRQLTNDARINEAVRFALATVAGALQAIPLQEEEVA